MELSHIREFLAFSDELNYTHSAKEFYISQATLIQHVSKLENELGFELVTHNGKPRLTTAGLLFKAEMSRNIKRIDETLTRCRAVATEGQDNLTIPHVIPAFAPAFFDSLSKENPTEFNVTYIDMGDSEYNAIEQVNRGSVDFSLIMSIDGMKTQVIKDLNPEVYGIIDLGTTGSEIYLSVKSPLATKEALSFEDFDGLTFLFDSSPYYSINNSCLIEQLTRMGVDFGHLEVPPSSTHPLLKADERNVCIMYAGAGQIMKVSSREDSLCSIPVKESVLQFRPYVIYRKDNENSAVETFASAWRDYLARTK